MVHHEARLTFSLGSAGLEQRQHTWKYRENLNEPWLEGSGRGNKCGKRGRHQLVGLRGSDAEHAECNLDGEIGVRVLGQGVQELHLHGPKDYGTEIAQAQFWIVDFQNASLD